jgi:4-hydroxybenzoate polyprenyltransferase
MRIHQWIKNSILFAGIIFAKKINDVDLLVNVIIGFFLFSLVASCQYIFNDYLDRKEDALHPEKKNRPLASGVVDPSFVLFLTVFILCTTFALSYYLNPKFFFIVIFYFLFNLTYSKYLKHLVILDVMSISIGFVLRAIAGAIIVNVRFSSWLLLCTFMLSLFWGFSKRRGELILLEGEAGSHRKILQEYSVVYLDLMMGISSTMTLMSYVLYTVSPETKQHLGTDKMFITIPIVVYAIFRSLYITYIKNMGHNPTKAILTDFSVLFSGFLWIVIILGLMHIELKYEWLQF